MRQMVWHYHVLYGEGTVWWHLAWNGGTLLWLEMELVVAHCIQMGHCDFFFCLRAVGKDYLPPVPTGCLQLRSVLTLVFLFIKTTTVQPVSFSSRTRVCDKCKIPNHITQAEKFGHATTLLSFRKIRACYRCQTSTVLLASWRSGCLPYRPCSC